MLDSALSLQDCLVVSAFNAAKTNPGFMDWHTYQCRGLWWSCLYLLYHFIYRYYGPDTDQPTPSILKSLLVMLATIHGLILFLSNLLPLVINISLPPLF